MTKDIYLSPVNWGNFCDEIKSDPTSISIQFYGVTFRPEVCLLYKLECDGQSLEVYKWPKGHVVWADGKIIFKSWET